MRELTKLQLLDHLIGQVDRRSDSYFIHMTRAAEGGIRAKVSGMENDLCFGTSIRHGNDISPKKYAGFHGTEMPGLVDPDMADAIRHLQPQHLADILSDKLSAEEVQATLSRLQSLRDHIDSLERDGRVVDADKWGEGDPSLLSQHNNAANSYLFRDLPLTLQE